MPHKQHGRRKDGRIRVFRVATISGVFFGFGRYGVLWFIGLLFELHELQQPNTLTVFSAEYYCFSDARRKYLRSASVNRN